MQTLITGLFILLFSATVGAAQDATATLRIEVRNADSGIAGAVVSVSGRTRRTAADGRVVVTSAPGPVRITVSAEGFVASVVDVSLAPGESREITVRVGTRELSYWSVETHDWAVASGRRAIEVGASSRDVRLRGEASVRPGP